MLQFSSQTIIYQPDQINQIFTVTNKSQTQVLFKIKTNNIKAIDARPNIGSIAPNNSNKITIKRNQNIDDNVKLQVTYLECPDVLTKDNFKQLWGKYQKGQHSRTFPVRVLNQQKKEDKKEGPQSSRNYERFNSVVSNSESDPSLFQSVRVSRKPEQQQQPQPKQTKQIPKTQPQPQSQSQSQQEAQIRQKKALESLSAKLEQQKQRNQALQQKLTQRQSQIKNFNEGKQLQINKFLKTSNCSKLHINYIVLIIIAVLCFGVGFYFGTGIKLSQDNF